MSIALADSRWSKNMNIPTAAKLIRNLSRLCLVLILGSFNARADVAILREKGPKSGALFSNPGLTEMSADVKVAMRDARVKIFLKKGEGNTLRAECEASFLLENLAPAETGPQEFLVAFPVTGLNSKMVTVDHFTVTVDGKTPPTVLRQAIAISRREAKLRDTAVAGQLAAHFAPEKNKRQWGVRLADQSGYSNSYVWSQHTTPGAKTQVKITYAVTLRPQSIQYMKSYQNSVDDSEVIPFEDLDADGADGDHYFFDYVLRSGATWEGPIAREVIELRVDPELKLHPIRISHTIRRPYGNEPQPPENDQPGDRDTVNALYKGVNETEHGVILDLKNIKPTRDLLFAIPVKALGQSQSKTK